MILDLSAQIVALKTRLNGKGSFAKKTDFQSVVNVLSLILFLVKGVILVKFLQFLIFLFWTVAVPDYNS